MVEPPVQIAVSLTIDSLANQPPAVGNRQSKATSTAIVNRQSTIPSIGTLRSAIAN